jgi:hypothetical protein
LRIAMTKPPSKSILSDDHINAIGRLVVAVSKIDSLLTDITAIFLQTDIWGTIIAVHHQQIASKLSTLESLIRQRLSAADAQGIWDVIKSAGDVAGFRNKIVHCHWTIDESGVVYAVRFQARGKFSRSRHQIDAVDIQQQADEADAIAGRLVGLRDHFLKTNTPDPHP